MVIEHRERCSPNKYEATYSGVATQRLMEISFYLRQTAVGFGVISVNERATVGSAGEPNPTAYALSLADRSEDKARTALSLHRTHGFDRRVLSAPISSILACQAPSISKATIRYPG
jgi:hypothetical protein